MSRKSLLIFLILMLSVGAWAATKSSDPHSGEPVLLADNSTANTPAQNVQNFQMGQTQPFAMDPGDDICYRIRAYIFKRDDDHAPEFVRSTTCGPRAAHAKDVKSPDAKLVPAK